MCSELEIMFGKSISVCNFSHHIFFIC
uniref:Uncharacterized protein n=1 Tax=Arundo donax TaxID=35708 RepID=A0A0A9H8U7_ARUDO